MGNRKTRRNIPRTAGVDPRFVPPRHGLEGDSSLQQCDRHGAAVESSGKPEKRRVGTPESSSKAGNEVVFSVTLGLGFGQR